MEYEKITEAVIGCGYRVHGAMGFGFLEAVYERCLLIELGETGLDVVSQHPVAAYYRGHRVGDFVADLVVEDTAIVELKSVRTLVRAHEVQLVNYLVATGKPVGLLLNFGPEKLEVRRKVRTLSR